jgi:hypothetical protein
MNHTKPTQKILFYGNSVLIESLTSKLQKIEGWEVKRREGGEVRELDNVNFIVTDLCDVTTSEALPMLSALPGVMLVGVDAIANTLTVLTGRSHPYHAMQDVLDMLKKAM